MQQRFQFGLGDKGDSWELVLRSPVLLYLLISALSCHLGQCKEVLCSTGMWQVDLTDYCSSLSRVPLFIWQDTINRVIMCTGWFLPFHPFTTAVVDFWHFLKLHFRATVNCLKSENMQITPDLLWIMKHCIKITLNYMLSVRKIFFFKYHCSFKTLAASVREKCKKI